MTLKYNRTPNQNAVNIDLSFETAIYQCQRVARGTKAHPAASGGGSSKCLIM